MGKISSFIFFLLLFSIHGNGWAQVVTSGSVTDVETSKGVFASVVLKDENGKILAYTNTKNDGLFELKSNNIGVFYLTASSLSYQAQTQKITIEDSTSQLKIDFVLNPKTTELNEVIISASKPITVKKDTIVFDAESFLEGNEQVIEDLLKKIPGLDVLQDGTIKVGGNEVEKVMVDGDDFFDKGYKMLTKNMPVTPIDKIEIHENYSNNKHLKGIENSNKVALNLTLKEEAKRVWFGNITGGYSLISNPNFELKSNLMNFGSKAKHFFLGNMNNIGYDAVGNINQLIRPFRFNEPGTIGDNQSVNNLLALNHELPKLSQKRVNLNNSKLLSLNSIFTLSDKVKLKTLGFLNTEDFDFFRTSTQQFSVGNSSFSNSEDFVGKKSQLTGFGKLDLTYDISKNKTLEYVGKFNQTNEQNRSDLNFNEDVLLERLNSNNQLLDQKLVLSNRFADTKVFLLSGRYIQEKMPQEYTVNRFIQEDLFAQNASNTKQLSQNAMEFAGVEAHLMDKKKNGDLFELKAGNQLRIDDLNTRLELIQEDDDAIIPAGYQNRLNYSTNDLYASVKYHKKFKNTFLIAETDLHQLFNRLENEGSVTHQTPFFLVPKLGMNWKINEKHKVITTYAKSTKNAGILDVYSGFVQTGFRNFTKGLGGFNQLNSSTAFLHYTLGSWSDKFFANAIITHVSNHDFLSTNSLIAQNFSQSEKIIIKDREALSFSGTIDRSLKALKTNLKINFGASQTNFKNKVNSAELREVKIFNADYGFELRSGFNGIFNLNLGSKWNFNQVETATKNSFTDNMSFLDLSFVFNDRFNLQTQTERYFFGNLDKGINQYYFLDLEGRYVVKENKLTLFLSGNNLFNTKTFRNYSISDISISQTEFRLMPRYLLFKAEYRF